MYINSNSQGYSTNVIHPHNNRDCEVSRFRLHIIYIYYSCGVYCVPCGRTAHNTHHSLKHFLPQHC